MCAFTAFCKAGAAISQWRLKRKKKGPQSGPFSICCEKQENQLEPVRQIVGSHLFWMPEAQVHTVLPALAPKIGVKVSVEPVMATLARCGLALLNVAVITPVATASWLTNLPVIEVDVARPADALLDGAVPRLL